MTTLHHWWSYGFVALESREKDNSMVSCQKGPTRHAYAWQIGPFWQDTLELCVSVTDTSVECQSIDEGTSALLKYDIMQQRDVSWVWIGKHSLMWILSHALNTFPPLSSCKYHVNLYINGLHCSYGIANIFYGWCAFTHLHYNRNILENNYINTLALMPWFLDSLSMVLNM